MPHPYKPKEPDEHTAGFNVRAGDKDGPKGDYEISNITIQMNDAYKIYDATLYDIDLHAEGVYIIHRMTKRGMFIPMYSVGIINFDVVEHAKDESEINSVFNIPRSDFG